VLVLTRKSSETVVIDGSAAPGKPLKVTVLKIRGRRVTLGFEADSKVPIYRLEIDRKRTKALHRHARAAAAL
jgi:carbon storage regulator CsrA